MEDKYIEERYPRCMVFGKYGDCQNVDVSDCESDIITRIPEPDAWRLVRGRDKLIDELIGWINLAFHFAPAAAERAWRDGHDLRHRD